MCLACCYEVGFNTQMDLRTRSGEPATATCGQWRRLWYFMQTKQCAVERASIIFATGWHGKLNMIETSDKRGYRLLLGWLSHR